jgi:prepilin-type N-terminal cleavage/methylation domain-containing protein
MAEIRRSPGARGFSLVEMMVALLFVGLLMAGMSTVFRSSVRTFYTAGEKLSNVRRSLSSVDLLYDDLNSAGMFLNDLANPPDGLSDTAPAFYILPNQPIDNPAPDGPATADELYFYLDQPLSFEGSLSVASGSTVKVASELVNDADGKLGAADTTYTVECGDPAYASQVKTGQVMIFKDFWEKVRLSQVTQSGSKVTITLAGDPNAGITGVGRETGASNQKHLNGTGIIFYQPAQMVRYRVVMRALDPQSAAGIPCLVREQAAYDPTGFPATADSQVVTENVQGFKVYLSADSGRTWAGFGKTYSGLDQGWTSGIQAELNDQLKTSGRAGFTTTANNLVWFRSIPALVRADITTRTAAKRSEYQKPGATGAAFNTVTQSLVLVPRHFGLPLN